MRIAELCAGIGGFGLGLEALGCEVAWASEIDPYCRQVMGLRQPHVEQVGDLREVDAGAPKVDGLTAGFPCQPVSAAGKGLAQADPRWLWPQVARVIGELEPSWVLIENVPMLRRRGMWDVLRDLDSLGYAAAWDGVPAAAVGAPHLRDRVWIVAWRGGYPMQPFGVYSGPVVEPDGKLPRAGQMWHGQVHPYMPVAPVKTTRRDGWSYWNGVQLGAVMAGVLPALLPTPEASDASGGRSAADPWATTRPSGAKAARYLASMAPLWPTPRAAWNENRGTRRSPSVAAGTHGAKLAEEVAEMEVEQGRERGPLNPAWVEWLMGFPSGYTDLSVPNEALQWRPWSEGVALWPTADASVANFGEGSATWFARRERLKAKGYNGNGAGIPLAIAIQADHDGTRRYPSHWSQEPLPRVLRDVPKRKERLQACGNALLPQVAAYVGACAFRHLRQEVTA